MGQTTLEAITQERTGPITGKLLIALIYTFPQYSYYVYEDQSQFLKIGSEFYRSNEIWRRKMLRQGGKMIQRELVTKNLARVKYIPAQFKQSDAP